MMEYSDFYDIAEYGNEHWKGNFTPKEIACNAYDYMRDFEWSKNNYAKHKIIVGSIFDIMFSLILDEMNGSEEAKYWLKQIADEIGVNPRKYFADILKKNSN